MQKIFSYFSYLLITCLFFSCQHSAQIKDNKALLDAPDKNPAWAAEYHELKTSEGFEKPIGFENYMRSIQLNNFSARQISLFNGVKELGPSNIGGRTRAFTFDRNVEDRYLAGSISGGLWESLDAGESWNPMDIFDQNINITSIEQSPLDPDIFYYSTGEVTGNSAGINGVGLFKSTDGGHEFEILENTEFIYPRTWRVECSKTDTQSIYLAHRGGLDASRDGGDNWEALIFSQVTDVETLPNGAVFAGVHSRGLMFSPTGEPGSFSFIGTDSLPQNGFNRIELAIAPSDTNTIYIAYEDQSDRRLLDIYKSENGGLNWSLLPHPQEEGGISFNFTWYCLALEVHPTKPNTIMIGSVGAGYSTDGGQSWSVLSQFGHVDRHLFAFDPFDEDRFIIGSDGGMVEGFSGVEPFEFVASLNNGYNVTQYYTGDNHPTKDITLGGTQDNGTHINNTEDQVFDRVFGGDGSFNSFNPKNPDTAYVSFQRGNMFRTYGFSNQFRQWDYIMDDLDFDEDGSIDDGTYFINPFYVDQDQSEKLYFPTRDRMWTSDDNGDTWYHLTDPIDNLYVIRTRVTSDTTTVGYIFGTGIMLRINNLLDHGAGEEISLSTSLMNAIGNAFIKDFEIHPQSPDTLYVAISSFYTQPRVWMVTNALSDSPMWESISGDLPTGLPVNGIAISHDDTDKIIIGTDYGVYTSDNGGENWVLETAIPNVPIFEVKLRHSDNKLFIYTHGRGIWTADILLATATNNIANNNKPALKIWPNPASNQINYKVDKAFKAATATVLSMDGRAISQLTLPNSNQQIIDIDHLSSDSYILWLKDKNGRHTSSAFIKE